MEGRAVIAGMFMGASVVFFAMAGVTSLDESALARFGVACLLFLVGMVLL
jgi:hypothetical protein